MVTQPSACLDMAAQHSVMNCLGKVPWPSACLDTVTRPGACQDTVPPLSAMPSKGASA